MNDEFPEQVLTAMYLTGNEKVLEIGGNIGRNSMIIATILNKNNNNNFVSVEMCEADCQKLNHNKTQNNLDFIIVNGAISKRKLIGSGWVSTPYDSDEILPDHYKIQNLITFNQLKEETKIDFDCEGAFYYIIQDMPEILDNIKLIIVENDYFDNNKQTFVANKLLEAGFELNYKKHLGNDPHSFPNFYEVWKKKQ